MARQASIDQVKSLLSKTIGKEINRGNIAASLLQCVSLAESFSGISGTERKTIVMQGLHEYVAAADLSDADKARYSEYIEMAGSVQIDAVVSTVKTMAGLLKKGGCFPC